MTSPGEKAASIDTSILTVKTQVFRITASILTVKNGDPQPTTSILTVKTQVILTTPNRSYCKNAVKMATLIFCTVKMQSEWRPPTDPKRFLAFGVFLSRV